MTFTPDGGSDPCAAVISSAAFPQFTENFIPGTILYAFGFDVQLTILESVWRFYSATHSIDQSFVIDHSTTTCLKVPEVTISGVVVGGVTGTLTFAEYSSSKIPFQKILGITEESERAREAQVYGCSCLDVAYRLCVNGRRHVDGPIEQVEFVWDEDLQDRWSYLPPCGDPTLDQEHIYLRGEGGDCYLEFDFEQSGGDTNDWADPPTSDGDVTKMVAIPICTCELFVQSETTGERFVTISGGRCANYRYVCGDCRCVPTYLCVFGEIGGAFIQSRATWTVFDDGDYGWVLDYNPEITIKLVTAECPVNDQGVPIFSDDRVQGCALRAIATGGSEEDWLTDQSNVIRCGFELSAEMEYYDEYSGDMNWLWVSSSISGSCAVTDCAECSSSCGGPPETLFVNIYQTGHYTDDPDDPIFGTPANDFDCDLTVEVHYWHRWDESTRGTPACGYIGYSAPITCGDDVYRVEVSLFNFGIDGRISRQYLSGPIFDASGPGGLSCTFSGNAITCEPFYKEMDTTACTGTPCFGGCDERLTDSTEISVYE